MESPRHRRTRRRDGCRVTVPNGCPVRGEPVRTCRRGFRIGRGAVVLSPFRTCHRSEPLPRFRIGRGEPVTVRTVAARRATGRTGTRGRRTLAAPVPNRETARRAVAAPFAAIVANPCPSAVARDLSANRTRRGRTCPNCCRETRHRRRTVADSFKAYSRRVKCHCKRGAVSDGIGTAQANPSAVIVAHPFRTVGGVTCPHLSAGHGTRHRRTRSAPFAANLSAPVGGVSETDAARLPLPVGGCP